MKEGRKRGREEGRKKRRKEGRKDGRKEGRKEELGREEERREGRKNRHRGGGGGYQDRVRHPRPVGGDRPRTPRHTSSVRNRAAQGRHRYLQNIQSVKTFQ